MPAHMGVGVREPIVMRMCMGVLGRRRELGHFGLRVHMGVRQPVIMIARVNVGVIVRAGHIAMRRGACMAVLAMIVASYWHVHFQSCMFQVMG